MMGRVLALTAVIASLSGAAVAQDFSGVASLGYSRASIDDIDNGLSIFSLDGKFDVKYESGLRIGADVSLNSINIDDVSENFGASSLGLNAGYRFASGFVFGGYLERSTLNVDDFDLDLTATSFGLSAGYAADDLTVRGFVGATTTDPELPNDTDITDYGVIAGYQALPNMLIAGSFVTSRVEAGSDSADLHNLGLAGVFGINDELTLFGGLVQTSLSEFDADVTTFGLGVSYDLSASMNFASSVSLELARSNGEIEGESANIDTVRLGVTIPMGGGSAKVPLNSVASSVMNPRHNAISGLVLSSF